MIYGTTWLNLENILSKSRIKAHIFQGFIYIKYLEQKNAQKQKEIRDYLGFVGGKNVK